MLRARIAHVKQGTCASWYYCNDGLWSDVMPGVKVDGTGLPFLPTRVWPSSMKQPGTNSGSGSFTPLAALAAPLQSRPRCPGFPHLQHGRVSLSTWALGHAAGRWPVEPQLTHRRCCAPSVSEAPPSLGAPLCCGLAPPSPGHPPFFMKAMMDYSKSCAGQHGSQRTPGRTSGSTA